MKPAFLTSVILICLCHGSWGENAKPHAIPDSIFSNAADYCFAYRETGMELLDSENRSPLTFRATRFALRFSQDRLAIETLAPLAGAPDIGAVMSARPPALPESGGWQFGLALIAGDRRFPVVGGPTLQADQQVADVGQFFQRRFLKNLALAAGAPAIDPVFSGLELAAWPDSITWRWNIRPAVAIPASAAEMSMGFPEGWRLAAVPGSPGAVLASRSANEGFLVLPAGQAKLSFVRRSLTARLPVRAWAAGEERNAGLRLIPLADTSAKFVARRLAEERSPLTVVATQMLPDELPLASAPDPDLGCVSISQPDTRKRFSVNDAFVRLRLAITNPDDRARPVRISLDSRREIAMAGLSNVITDADWTPIGVPLQITKDWHDNVPDRFMGPWVRRIAVVTIPPRTTVTLGVSQAYAFWGGVPAASVCHLSCIGYPANQQNWGQAALGAWQESITFWPSPPAGWAHICDVRAPMADGPGAPKWGWSGNVGGGSWLRYETDGQPVAITQVRDDYEVQMPNLASVTYAGLTADGAIASRVTASITRTDDYVRVFFHVRFDALRDTEFSRLAWFQLGADTYDYAIFRSLAIGDASGLREEWPLSPQPGTQRDRQPLTGHLPWFSLHDTRENNHQHPPKPGKPAAECLHAQATRGLIVRRWAGRLDGKDIAAPSYSVIGHEGFAATALVELTPPPGVNRLRSGDYQEADLEWIVLPSARMSYYGPNQAFAAAHAADADTWKPVLREAVGNDLNVSATGADVLATYPVRLRALPGTGEITFTLTGGLSYVPVTIEGLPGYENPTLEIRAGDEWAPVSQSVHGNDWWQARYEPASKTWQITYNLDATAAARTYRFHVKPR